METWNQEQVRTGRYELRYLQVGQSALDEVASTTGSAADWLLVPTDERLAFLECTLRS